VKVFVSYASEQRDLAQRIALALTGAGIDVFFDRDDLAPAGEFNLAIRRAIHDCDLFLFVASREALAAGAYTLTELGIAQRRWPHPAQRVLTLLADSTPIAELPPYLASVTVLRVEGDAVAETVDAVLHERDRRRRRWRWAAGAAAGGLVLGLGLVLWRPWAPTPSAAAAAVVADIDDGTPNARVYGLKNGRRVRLVGSLVRNDSNVAERIVRKAIESNAWRYNRCYDQQFGQLAGALPEGRVEIAFEIDDQLPRRATVHHSDFALPGFGSCVQAVLLGQTLNEAGPNGSGKIVYRLAFLPN
jgi:hypothetical protein